MPRTSSRTTSTGRAPAKPAASRRGARASVSPTSTEVAQAAATISIGELAKTTRMSTRTIRYYEELGVLPAPPRSDGGTRRYPREYVFYVEGARILKELGFSLDEIAELGRYALRGTSASKQTRVLLQGKIAEMEHRIRVLNRLHDLVVEAASAPRRANASPVPTLLKWLGAEGESVAEAS